MQLKNRWYCIVLCLVIGCTVATPTPITNCQVNQVELNDFLYRVPGHALLLTHYKSFDDFKSIVEFEYADAKIGWFGVVLIEERVNLTCQNHNFRYSTVLADGISEGDFWKARDGSFWQKVWLGMRCPYVVLHKTDLRRIEYLSRKRPWMFGQGDVAFYDLAESMVFQISIPSAELIPAEDFSEKGYLNTFNHVTAQAFMTSMFSERMADFVADVHERQRMPELITGQFTIEQINDLQDGPTDNYIDMLNNEIGQELGKWLKEKYQIDRTLRWSPQLLAAYLNDIQRYFSWAFQIGFQPFNEDDEILIQFADKINVLMKEVPMLKSYYMM